jgi:hypothetical protein
LSPLLASAFEGLALVQHTDRADLVGKISDQAELHGHLTRIRDLGLELESLSVLPDPGNPNARAEQT